VHLVGCHTPIRFLCNFCNRLTFQERLAALEECRELGQGFQLAERDMGIRGFGTIFGEQQTGDVGNVGVDFFFEMLFESLSKVCFMMHFIISYLYIEKEEALFNCYVFNLLDIFAFWFFFCFQSSSCVLV